MECPACGAHVSKHAATCAICGKALVESAVAVGSGRLTVVKGDSAALEPNRCPACGGSLENEASFCSDCGAPTHTGEFVSPLPPEPEPEPAMVYERLEQFAQFAQYEDDVVVRPTIAPEPPVEYVEYVEDDVVATADLDLARGREPVRERVVDRTGPIQVVREQAPAGDSWSGWVPAAAAAFAVFALLVALLVHVFGPVSLPNHTPAEVDLKIQMRAVEWLLAGILIALLGLLAKR